MMRRCDARSDAHRSSRLPSRCRTMALVLISIVVGVLNVEAASLDLSWTGPTTNADGTPLVDLAGYRVYLGAAAPPPCPGTPFDAVASSSVAPATGETVAYQVGGLSTSVTYVALISAVDSAGNESGCAGPVSGFARADLTVSPAGAVNFGSTTVGIPVDSTFTVQNVTSSSMTGAASVGSPFSVVSGSSFSLAPGASQAVIVRLLSTTVGNFASNVNVTANGDTVSRTVTGSATGSAGARLAITRNGTGMGTVTSAPAGITCGSDCTETVVAGTSVILTAAAASGSTFSGWSGGGCSGAAGCTVTLNADTTVTATFNTSPTVPVPVASSLSPSSANVGAPGFALIVNGSGFVSSSVVRWNGAARTTTFVSASQLRAAIAASDIAAAGSVAVGVFTPAPAGGTSATLAFTVTAAAIGSEIVIDNAGPGAQDPAGGRTFTGMWCLSNAAKQFGPSSLRSCGTAGDTYRWTPTIAVTGTYDVYVWIPRDNSARSTSVPILVAHASGTTTRIFNERKASGSWVLHGRYTFNAGTAGYVQTSAENGTALADAVRFTPIQ
jgi:Divergent InlB B-repeat domain